MTIWAVIIPVIVLEGKSAGESFSRSRELVRGYGWGVLGVIVLTVLLLIGVEIVLGLILSPFADWLRGLPLEHRHRHADGAVLRGRADAPLLPAQGREGAGGAGARRRSRRRLTQA